MNGSVNKHRCTVDLTRSEDVSTVIIGTCRMHPRLHRDVFDSMQFDTLSRKQVLLHSFHSGSSAEFYIKPIHSCIGDIDYMLFMGNILAFIEDVPVLPEDFRGLVDTICCLQIMPYPDYPGFVRLQHLGTMIYNWHGKKFQCHKTNKVQYLASNKNPLIFLNSMGINNEPETVGPAVRRMPGNGDAVPCHWCPQWPREAQDWTFRRRNHGWPTSANIRHVVRNGCHVVFAKHPACRDDEYQWRLSFSGAELCLLQSWSSVQQIVYHMLRFFAKKELIKKDCPKKDEVLCTYHFKTLMLWSCEEMPREWWNSYSVVAICCYLLRKLSEWIKKRFFPNFFIPVANLLHEGMNQNLVNETIGRLNDFCHFNRLNGWFAVDYITPILERVLSVEDIMKPVIDFGYCILRICEVMNAEKLAKFDFEFSYGFFSSVRHTSPRHNYLESGYMFHSHIESVCCVEYQTIKEVDQGLFLSTVEFKSKFPQFGKVLFILHSANVLGFNHFKYDSELFTEFIREVSWKQKVVRSKYHNFPKPSKTSLHNGDVLFLKAQDLMENLTGLNGPQEFKLLSRLSKELLRNAIYCDGFKSSGIQRVALVYMAALHFYESDYETAINLSSTSFDTQTPDAIDNNEEEAEEEEEEEEEEDVKQEERETLNAGCLLYIDYVVRIIGFYLLFSQIRNNYQFKRRHYLLKMCLTPDDVSHYLIVPSIESRHKANRLNYELKVPTLPLSESHYHIAIDFSSTIFDTETPGYDDDKDNNEKEVAEKEKKNEKLNARCLIHFSESIYTIVLKHSLTNFISQPPGYFEAEQNEEKETLNAGCLLYIDDVAAIVGFYLIFRRIQDNIQYNRRLYLLDLRLTPEVFAHYLITSSNERRSKAFRQNCKFQPPTFPMDEILTTITNRKSATLSQMTGSAVRVYQRTDQANESEASRSCFANEFDIIQLLIAYSLETMNSFYNVLCKDFYIRCNPVDCYRAAYLYKCRKYPEVLQLCDRILNEPVLQRNLEELTFANVMVMPPLDSYFDTDIQCLIGLHTLVCYLSPLNDEFCQLECTDESTFQQVFATEIYFEKRSLSVFLRFSYFLKCPYFLGRHFLARYLKVRILIDCNHSNSEVMLEFKKLKIRLPFEHIMCRFLRKLLLLEKFNYIKDVIK